MLGESPPPTREPFRIKWIFVAVLATLLMQAGLALLGLPPEERRLAGDEGMYVSLGKAWSRGEPVDFDPLWPPGYSAILAASFRFSAPNAIFGVQLLALFATMACLARLAMHAGIPHSFAIGASVLFGCDPQVASFVQTFWPEILHLSVMLLLFELCLTAPPSVARGVLAGLTGATALLLKNLLTPFLPLLLVAQAARAGSKRRAAVLASSTLVTLGALLPLSLHNLRTHDYFGVSDSVPFNLVLGLTDTTRRGLAEPTSAALHREYLESGSTFAQRQKALRKRLEGLITLRDLPSIAARQLGRQPFRLLDRESTFQALLPGGSLHARGRGYRAPPHWLAGFLSSYGSIHYGALLLLAPLGLAVIRVEKPYAARWILAWGSFVALAALLLHTQARHRVVLIPALALCAAQGCRWLLQARRATPLSRASLILSGLASLALLGFAFGAP